MSSLEDIDTSSGALGSVLHRTLDHLIPILISGPVDVTTRSACLERLFQAVNGRWCAVPRASRGSMERNRRPPKRFKRSRALSAWRLLPVAVLMALLLAACDNPPASTPATNGTTGQTQASTPGGPTERPPTKTPDLATASGRVDSGNTHFQNNEFDANTPGLRIVDSSRAAAMSRSISAWSTAMGFGCRKNGCGVWCGDERKTTRRA